MQLNLSCIEVAQWNGNNCYCYRFESVNCKCERTRLHANVDQLLRSNLNFCTIEPVLHRSHSVALWNGNNCCCYRFESVNDCGTASANERGCMRVNETRVRWSSVSLNDLRERVFTRAELRQTHCDQIHYVGRFQTFPPLFTVTKDRYQLFIHTSGNNDNLYRAGVHFQDETEHQ